MTNYKIKLVDNKAKANSGVPQFTLSYNAENRNSQSSISYEIITLLKEGNDIVIEIDTSLILQSKKSKKFIPEDFISEIKKLNLEYSYKKSQSQKQDFFSTLFGMKKTEEEHVVTVYVPDNVWRNEALKKILPDCGVRYLIKKDTDEARKVLDEMNLLLDNERNNYFSYVIFDVSEFNQMGITSSHYGFEDIKKILGIVWIVNDWITKYLIFFYY